MYEATENTTGETYAIKILTRYEDDDEQAEKFKHEIDIISSLKHENIIGFVELDQDEGNYYVVMELVKGGELFDQIIDRGGFSSKDAALIICQILRALQYMHTKQTAHRDIKPENILFKDTNYDVVKIADFGESKHYGTSTMSTYCGTPDYMAPEIIKGLPYGPAVDMWAIGVIAYVILVGFPPFDGENDVEVFASIMAVRYDFPSPEWDDVPKEAKNFIASILKEEPSERLTAEQALAHPWIVKNVPENLRTLATLDDSVSIEISAPPTERDSSDEASEMSTDSRKKSKKHEFKVIAAAPDDELGALDVNSNPSQRVLDAIASTQQLARSNLGFMGELVTMEAIVRMVMGDPTEKLITPIYWKRLLEIRKICNSDKKKRSSKK